MNDAPTNMRKTDKFFDDSYKRDIEEAQKVVADVNKQLAKKIPSVKKFMMPEATTEGQNPDSIKIIANITAEDYTSADNIRQGLVKQLIQPILWQACMERLLAEGIENFYEIGPGRVLTGLMKRINRKTKVTNISSVESLQEVLK